MKLRYLWQGLPGHPLHPPLTDAAIGIFTFATIAALADVVGITEEAAAHGWWLALVVGLVVSAAAAVTGFLDWLTLTWWTPMWRTATSHMIAMLAANACFGLAAITGHGSFDSGDVTAGPLVLTLVAFGLLTLGGWIGGTIVFVHGMRVLGLPEEPALRASLPVVTPEEEEAAAS